ncbi:MAG: asparagine synthase-related protein [Pseudonocardia sp.]
MSAVARAAGPVRAGPAGEFLAVSAAPGRAHPAVDAPGAGTPIPGGTCHVVAGAGLGLLPRDRDQSPLDARALARSLHTGPAPLDLAPPGAVLQADRDGLLVGTDDVGLHHVYGVRGDGWAAVASSPWPLARLAGAPLDEAALGAYRLIGHHLGTATPWRGVEILPAAGRWRLADGRLDALPRAPAAPVEQVPARVAVGRVAALLRAQVGRVLDEFPDVVLELSGGLDSRILLAAIPRARRRDVAALTLRASASADDAVAGRLAAATGMRRHVVDLDELAALTPAAAHALVHAAAVGYGGVAQPVAMAVLDWAEARAPQEPRLNGQGGEFARGFYHPGQPARPAPTSRLVHRLARWRLFVNDVVDPAVLEPGFAARTGAATLATLERTFAAYRTDWLGACDEFYLDERLRRWVGADVSRSGGRRVVLAPYFHSGVLAAARGLSAEVKRGSAFSARLLAHLDPELAAVPLAGGAAPVDLGRRGPGPAARAGWRTAADVAAKVTARHRGAGRAPLGADLVAQRTVAHWRAHPELLDPVRATGLVDDGRVAAVLRGEIGASAATVGFLAVLQACAPAAGPRPIPGVTDR